MCWLLIALFNLRVRADFGGSCFVPLPLPYLAAGNDASIGRADGQRAMRDGDHQEPHEKLLRHRQKELPGKSSTSRVNTDILFSLFYFDIETCALVMEA